jgi:2-keto-4-pentenoate hydratase/2-oxohepta-3-ene-1,7-dioic acid hydratase in catechol pathway
MRLTQDEVGKFVALGGTFSSHLEETGRRYRWPDLWVVPPQGVINEGEPIEIPPRADHVKPGAELTAVIGEDVWMASESEAWDAIAGLTISNDVTASGEWPGWSDPDHPNITGVGYKIFPTFSPVLSEVTPRREPSHYDDLDVSVTVDGEPCVSGSTRQMAFSIPEMVSFASQIVKLRENDLVALGDPGEPSIILDEASEVTCAIETIGELTNPVRQL